MNGIRIHCFWNFKNKIICIETSRWKSSLLKKKEKKIENKMKVKIGTKKRKWLKLCSRYELQLVEILSLNRTTNLSYSLLIIIFESESFAWQWMKESQNTKSPLFSMSSESVQLMEKKNGMEWNDICRRLFFLFISCRSLFHSQPISIICYIVYAMSWCHNSNIECIREALKLK